MKKFSRADAKKKRRELLDLFDFCTRNVAADRRDMRRAAELLWDRGYFDGQRVALADMRKAVR